MQPRSYFIAIIIIFTCSISLYSQGEAAVPFLLLKPGAEANGMAGSYTALANGASAMYFNPAGLTQTDKFSWNFSYEDLMPNYYYYKDRTVYTLFSSAVYTYPDIGSFGISLQYFHIGKDPDIHNYFNQNGDDFSISVGYGRKLCKTISGGITLKYIHSQFGYSLFENESGTYSASAVAFDLGVLFTNFLPELCESKPMSNGVDDFMTRKINKNMGPSIGIALSNMGNEIYYVDEDQSDPLPQNLRLGLAWTVINNDILGVTVSSDILKLLVNRYTIIKDSINQSGHDSFPKSLFTSWKDFKFEELEISLGLEFDITGIFTFRVGRFFEDENYGNRNYYTYGFSVGPEFARFSMSFFDTVEKDQPLDGTIIFEGAVRL